MTERNLHTLHHLQIQVDFHSQNQALEIKTTTSNDRIHNFSYEQLNAGNEKLVICSIMLRFNRSGKSLEDLKKGTVTGKVILSP